MTIDSELEALRRRIRALELREYPYPEIPPIPPFATTFLETFPSQTLPVGLKNIGCSQVPLNRRVHLWGVFSWRITGSFCNQQWFHEGVRYGPTVGAQYAGAGTGQAITATNQMDGWFTSQPVLQFYSGVATVIDEFFIGGIAF